MEILWIFADAFAKFAATYLVGTVILFFSFRQAKWGGYAVFFFKFLLGIIALSTGFAIVYARGMTVLWCIVPLWVGSAFFLDFRVCRTEGKPKDEIVILLMSLAVFFILVLVQLFRNGFFQVEVACLSDIDFGIYATVAEYLKITGVENPSPWYEQAVEIVGQKPMPYHYGDLWYASFVISWGFPIQPLEHYVYVFIPLLSITLFWGFLAMVKHFLANQKLGLWIAGVFLLLFFNAWFPWIPGAAGGLYATAVLAPKSFFFQVGVVAFILLWLKGQEQSALWLLAAISLFNVLFVPAVLGGCFLFFAYRFYWEKENLRPRLMHLLIPLLSVFFILAFYVSFGSLKTGLTPSEMTWATYLYRLFRGLASGALRFLVFEFLAVWLFALSVRRWANLPTPIREIIAWAIGFWMGALFAKALFNPASAEVDQLFYLVANPLASIGMLFLVLVLYFLKKESITSTHMANFLAPFLLSAFSFAYVLLVFQQRDTVVSSSFVNTLSESLEGRNKLGAFLPNPRYLDTYRADPRMCTFCNFLKLAGKEYWANNIAVPADTSSLPFPDRKNAIMMSPFYRYANAESNQNKSLKTLQLSFINDNQVDFVVVEQGVALPDYLAACVSETIKDSISGHAVYILDRPCE